MGKRKKDSGGGGGANWMDTYGDLVTLLLCFFVLLYSISTVDQAKWVQIVKSFNPDAREISQIADDPDVDGVEEIPGGLDNNLEKIDEFDELYDSLKEAVEQAGLDGEVELFKGDGYTFITFRDNVFFDGDSSIIKSGGAKILKQFSSIIAAVSTTVKEIQVLGHTTQADPNEVNEPVGDRVLSAERAARVAAFIQTRSKVPPKHIVSIGYGQFRPIAPFDTEENRSKNRRVELLITKSDSVEQSLEQYYEDMGR